MASKKIPTVKLAAGNEMPMVGLGCWLPSDAGTFSPETEKMVAAIHEAIAAGYRAFDTALIYNTEPAMGCAFKENFDKGVLKREDLFVTTKLPGSYMSTPDLVRKGVNLSLNNLQFDYIDLYLLHGPWTFEPSGGHIKANFEEIWKTLEEFVDAGKIKALGLSNFNSKQIDRIRAVAHHPVSNLQVECHAYLQQEKLWEFCKKHNIAFTAYSPIGAPGRPDHLKKEGQMAIIDDPVILELAKKYSKSPAQILLRWHLQRGIIVVPKSVTPKRIQENIQITDFSIADADIKTINALNKNLRYFEFKEIYGTHPDHPFNEEF